MKVKQLRKKEISREEYADVIIDSHFVFSNLTKAFSDKNYWDHLSCRDCADFKANFCAGYNLINPEMIDTCIDRMIHDLPGTCEIESDGMGGITVTLTHESPSGIIHPHMYGLSEMILKDMDRKVTKGKVNILGGCECDWSKISRVK